MEIQAGGGVFGLENPGGRGGQKTLPSVGGVWIFSGITHCGFNLHVTQSSSKIKNYKSPRVCVLGGYKTS